MRLQFCKRWLSIVALLIVVFLGVSCGVGMAADLHVDPQRGEDTADGTKTPVKSIAAAIRRARPGDTIHLMPKVVYRDWAAFFDKSGEPGNPITLDGHGAILDGCDPLDVRGWIETEPGLFHHDNLMPLTDAIIARWFLVQDGHLNRMRRCSKGPSEPLKAAAELQPGEWTFIKDLERTKSARPGYIFGTFWLRLKPGQKLAEAKIEAPMRPAGVLIHGTSSHLVIRNLTATRPYNDGFNLSDSRHIQFENIQALNCGDDGISAHGHCLYTVDGLTSIGNATGICDTGTSETSYQRVLIRDCIGFDLYFLDSGKYTVRNSEIISSAARAFYLSGRTAPAEPCRVLLENVLIRREKSENEVRVSANCELRTNQVTLLNLDIQATGGTLELSRTFIGGSLATHPPRKPRLHLWKDAKWRGQGNWYDLDSVRVAQETFTEKQFDSFTRSVTGEVGSRWEFATEATATAAGIGARPMPITSR